MPRRKRSPTHASYGVGLPRLAVGVLMLVVLAALISRTGDPNTWRWLVREGSGTPRQIAAGASSEKLSKNSSPAGPTDEDPDEMETAQGELQAITDGTTVLGPEEMAAYDRLVAWTKNQSFARLSARATKGLWYADLYDASKQHRGNLAALDVDVRRAKAVGRNSAGVSLYEAWATTEESRGRLYDLIVVDYPKGMPVGCDMRERARFVGYFLKLQGYESGASRPGDPPERAPLLIGRLDWRPVAAPTTDSTWQWIAGAVLLCAIAAFFAFRLVYHCFAPRRASPLAARRPDGDASLEQWLEQAAADSENSNERREAVQEEKGG